MKLMKLFTRDNYLESESFNFKPIKGLNKFDIFTSYVKGETPEFQNDMDKLLMVLEGNINLKINKQNTNMTPGDIILIQCGEKFKVNANHGAKLLQFNPENPISNKDKVMEFACARHSTRSFSDKPVLKKDIYYILKTGMHAPSGANRQPWKFIVVSDSEIKRKIREAAEQVEKRYYKKMQKTKLKNDFNHMGLSWNKQFLETAPFLICIFGDSNQPYYRESIWLAAGWMLLAAEELGLSTLTYTPSEMKFLTKLLKVNENYTPELILPIGYSEKLEEPQPRKDLGEVVTWI